MSTHVQHQITELLGPPDRSGRPGEALFQQLINVVQETPPMIDVS
ncbi:MAG: hypothetical protein O7G88_19745 [bacterium]|nr:hypothetical protein [bacterium]